MGNKQSSGKGDGVKRRDKSGKKRKSQDRPVSMPGLDEEDLQNAPNQAGMRRAGSVDITNMQNASEVRFNQGGIEGTGDLAGESVFNLYKKSLHQVLTTWPELVPLREIEPKKVSKPLLQALQKLYDIVYKREEQVDTLHKDKKILKDLISDLEQKNEDQVEECRKKDNDISDLDHKVCLLEGELRKRGIAPRVSSTEHDYPPPEIERGNKKRRSGLMPTPFMQAGGQRGQDAAIKRSNSMLTDARRSGGPVGAPDGTAILEDLNLKVRSLQLELEQKRRENEELRDRLEGGFDPGSSLKQLAPHSGPNVDMLIDFYSDLEERALTTVTETLVDILTDKTDEAIRQFLCFVMETSFQQASNLMKIFLDTVHSLLTHPLKPELSQMSDTDNKASRTHGHLNKTMFERGPDLQGMSRLARRTRLTTELPKYLEEEVASFIRVTSDSTNIDVLIEEVQGVLHQKFPSYATDHVFSDSTFSNFLSGCCRMSWQLCAMSPPCHVTIDDARTRYDEYYHDVIQAHKNKVTIGAELDYFIWPMMLRKKNGEVLYKARVALISKNKGPRF